MHTALQVLVPLFAIGATVGFVLGYHKWMSTWVRPWFDKEQELQEIEDYANHGNAEDEH